VPEYVLTLLVTAAVTYLLTPLVRRGAIAARAMHAARDRDVHVVPIPLLGGLAIYGGLAAGLMVAGQLTPLRAVLAGNRTAVGLLLAGGLIVVVGVVDDRWGLSPISKLAGQAAAGGILYWSGAQLGWLPMPGNSTLVLTPNESTALTIFLVVATINAVNFIDGLDGLAAGVVCIAALAFFAYYYRLTQVYVLPEQAGPALASAILAGACLGFLPHNFYPARIFMGDTGSMLLGLLLAYIPISTIASLAYADNLRPAVNRFPEILPLLLPAAILVILVIPYADLLLAVVRRTRAGLSPLAPDRKHLHHRLLDIGHSHRSSVLIMYLWAALFAGTVVWLSIAKTPLIVLALTTLAAMLALLMMSMPQLRWWQRSRRAAAAAAGPAVAGAAVAGAAVTGPVPAPALPTLSAPVPAGAVPPAPPHPSAPSHPSAQPRPAGSPRTSAQPRPPAPSRAATSPRPGTVAEPAAVRSAVAGRAVPTPAGGPPVGAPARPAGTGPQRLAPRDRLAVPAAPPGLPDHLRHVR
jgi:UDP-GlcNAc:undecaprenyl-phosphate/decaprenyl-phosphate GlcNAc-1-phosphate transferase